MAPLTTKPNKIVEIDKGDDFDLSAPNNRGYDGDAAYAVETAERIIVSASETSMQYKSQLWINLLLMLAMLTLGSLALLLGHADANPYLLWLVPGAYLASTGLWTFSLSRSAHHHGWNKPIRPARETELLFTVGILIDVAFLLAVMMLTTSSESVVFAAIFSLAVTRLIEEPRRLWGRIVLLVLPLPVLYFCFQIYSEARGSQLDVGDMVRIATLALSAMLVAYALVYKRRTKEAGLVEALRERDQRLEESRLTVLQASKRLAEQLLRVDILQDGIKAINSTVELDSLLQMIANNTLRVLKADQSSIGLIDKQSGELAIRAIAGVERQLNMQRHFKIGVGVAGWVAQHGKALLIKDVYTDPRFIDFYKESRKEGPARSMLCVPLIVEGKVIGALCVTRFWPDYLTTVDEVLLTSFAEQVALAVHKSQLIDAQARQQEEIKQHVEMLSTLHSIAEGVLSSLNLAQVLDTVATRISELSNFDYGAIYLVNEHTGKEERVVIRGRVERPRDLELDGDTVVTELWEHARVSGLPQWNVDATTVLCLPMVDRGEAIGCIVLAREGSRPFSEGERDTAQRLAYAATIAVVNARLFARTSAQEERTAALYRLVTAVNSFTNRSYLSRVICQELHKITNAGASALLVLDSRHHSFAAWAACGAWESSDIEQVAQRMSSHNFIHEVLAALYRKSDPSTLAVAKAPYQITEAFNSATAVTIPMMVGPRLIALFIFEPGTEPAIPEDILETISLAVSNSAMALERTELFEQTVDAAHQSSLLYKFAVQVQPLSDSAAVTQLTADYLLRALPLRACEIYLFDEGYERLSKATKALARYKDSGAKRPEPGPQIIAADDVDTVAALTSANLITAAAGSRNCNTSGTEGSKIVLARLMGGKRPLGIVRMVVAIAAEEFVQRHSTLCQTLLTHSGGALERARLYSTVTNQAKMLRQASQRLNDIFNLGRLSSANVPLPELLPEIARSIQRSLDCKYVRLGSIGSGSENTEIWAFADEGQLQSSHDPPTMISTEDLEHLMAIGRPTTASVRSVYLDERVLSDLLHGRSATARTDDLAIGQVILMLLQATSGKLLGYLIAPSPRQIESSEDTGDDRLEVLSVFGRHTATLLENRLIYNQLLASKREIDAVVLSISDAVIVTNVNMEFLITNNLANQLLGISPGSEAKISLQDLVKDHELVALTEECIATSNVTRGELEFSVGKEQWTFEATAYPILSDQRDVSGIVITLRDVTAQRALERTKSDFLSIVSHELRTPMNSVLGFMDIILSGRTGPLNELQSDFLSTARQEGAVLHRLISDLLDYSQLHGGMLRMETVLTDLSRMMDRVANQWAAKLDGDAVRLVNNLPSGLSVQGDEIRLAQVFNNLIDNAIKFTREGEIRISCKLEGDSAIISVADTGAGISPSQLNSIFDRFFQADNNAGLTRRGLGLGLAICKNIIEGHDGEMWAESELGVGTTIFIRLPLAAGMDGAARYEEDAAVV